MAVLMCTWADMPLHTSCSVPPRPSWADTPLHTLCSVPPLLSICRPAADLTPDWFGRGRVVILGDAAHPMRPTGQVRTAWLEGEGTAMRTMHTSKGT